MPRSCSRRSVTGSRWRSFRSSSTATTSGPPSSVPRRSSSSSGTWPVSGSAVTADVARSHPSLIASADRDAAELLPWRVVLAGPVVAVVSLLLALVATRVAGVTFRDWEHAVAWRCAWMAGVIALLVLVDIVVRAGARSRKRVPTWAAVRAVQRERWTPRRLAALRGYLGSFYEAQPAYRLLNSENP